MFSFFISFILFVNADDVFVFFVFFMYAHYARVRPPHIAHRSSPLLRLPMDISIHTDTYYVCKYKLLFFFAHARRSVHIPLLHAKLPLQCDMNSQCAISCCGQACSRQLACRRQSDTGFSKLRAAGAQYYCTVVASLSDRRSRSHGAMACAFCVFFFYTTRLPSTVDLISCSLLYSVPAFQVVLLPMLASCVLVACIMQLSLIPLGTERNSGYAAELDKSDEHWARRTKLTSTYASRLSEKQIGCPTSASEKRKRREWPRTGAVAYVMELVC